MSQKQSTPETDRRADASPEAHDAEPITVKDRRFWAKKAKTEGHDAPATPNDSEDESASADGPAPEVARHLATIEELRHKLADKEQRLNATVAQYKEALDEFEGAKARLRRDVTKDVEAGKRAILVGLLDVIDNLERALGAASANTGDKSADFTGFFDGVTMVRDQFIGKLQALGVGRVASLGQPFDPKHFEAISTVPVTDQKQHDTVVGVVRDAYLLGGETLRHGIVAVGKFAG